MRSWFVTVWLSIIGCSAGTDPLVGADAGDAVDGGAVDVPMTAREYCDAFVAVSRSKRVECYGGTFETYRLLDEEYRWSRGCDDVLAELGSGTWRFAAERAEASLVVLENMACVDVYLSGDPWMPVYARGLPVVDWLDPYLLPRLTRGALTGAQTEGQSCSFDTCDEGLTCVYSPRVNEARCRRVDTVNVGEVCDLLHACGEGAHCAQPDGDARCEYPGVCVLPAQPQRVGESCRERACEPTSYCRAVDQVCQPIMGEGARCFEEVPVPVWEVDCGSRELACVPTSPNRGYFECLRGARLGEACGAGVGFCLGASTIECDIDPATSVGVCRLPARDGEPCTQRIGCRSSSCVLGLCQDPLPVGESCAEDSDCASFRCDEGACGAREPEPDWPEPVCE